MSDLDFADGRAMNDLEILRDAWAAPEAPLPAATAKARGALLTRARGRRPALRRPRVRLAAAGGVVAIAAAVTVAINLGDGRPAPGVPVASAAEVLERAAAAAERKPYTAPRGDQWIYVEDRFTSSDGGAAQTRRTWTRADGRGLAWLGENGKLHVEPTDPVRRRPDGKPIPLYEDYESLAALPTDPHALLRWAYEQAEHTTGAGLTEHGDVYAIFNHMVRGNVLPPELQAAIFRALKRVPGVTVETVDVFGRPALALGQTEDWLREELLLDPVTYEYRGERSTVVRDTTIDPLKAGNATGEVRRGSKVVSERVATAIVEEPGERP